MAKAVNTEAAQEVAEPKKTDLGRQAYDTATSLLRKNHQDEFNTLRQQAAKELGVEWKPRPSPAERAAAEAAAAEAKAEAALQALLAKNPHLAAKVTFNEPEAEASPSDEVL